MIKDITPVWGQPTKLILNTNGLHYVITSKKVGLVFQTEAYKCNANGVVNDINDREPISPDCSLDDAIKKFHKLTKQKTISIKENVEKELLLD